MNHPLGFCRTHGFFPVGGIVIENSKNVSFDGGVVQCPTCRKPSELISGSYTSIGDKLKLYLGPSVSMEALKALRDIAVRLQRDEITSQQAKHEAEKISPRFGGIFDAKNWSKEVKAAICAAIISSFGTAVANKLTTPSTPTITVQPVIERVIERHITDLKYKPRYVPIPIPRPKR
ncbi:hypothetical protein [Ochrobactrum sp. MYb379]|uniref:hypothetical protein n=1 Tax=Ochrobactrum sp. MYb379 TaxID=2745275 RepID=UPI0030959380